MQVTQTSPLCIWQNVQMHLFRHLKKDMETESDAKSDFELKVGGINIYQLLNTCSTRHRHQVPHRREIGSMRAGNSENHHTWVSGIVIAKILSLIFSTAIYSKHSEQSLYLYFKRN